MIEASVARMCSSGCVAFSFDSVFTTMIHPHEINFAADARDQNWVGPGRGERDALKAQFLCSRSYTSV